jgi:hypothetical protein
LLALAEAQRVDPSALLRSWIHQGEGKSSFLFTYGRLSAYALERIPIGDRSGQG